MAEATTEYEGEKCVRCGDVGEDRRTLWHSCFYAMDELGLPFEQLKVKGESFAFEGMKPFRFSDDPRFATHEVPQFAETASGKVDRQFFTLRVCKDCRSSWMGAIKAWFNAPIERRESCGSGIFVRDNGATVEITEDEWKRRYGHMEPIRFLTKE